ncbi:hypothetical protein FSOLCH5_013279 [Fusarium solani]
MPLLLATGSAIENPRMTTRTPKDTYAQPEYEEAHLATFAAPKGYPIESVLPPDVKRETFEQALAEFVDAVGKDYVFIGDALSHYIDPYDIYIDDSERRRMPSAAVCPSSLEEAKQALKVANKYGIPVWAFSRGKNLGYGGPSARVNGSVAFDLHRMNRVLEVSDDFSYAVVEPGVSFKELGDYCSLHGKKVWPSTPSLGWGSVTGNTLDRGTGFGSHSAHHQSIAGLEVLLPDGDVVRTGQFGITRSPSAFLSKFTFGPSIEGLFLQSNLGIVTKLSIWLTPQPPAFMECTIGVPAFEDIEPLVDVLGHLRQTGVIPNLVWVMSLLEQLCMFGRRSDYWQGEGPIPPWKLEEIRKEKGMNYWHGRWGLYGPKRIIQAQFEEIKEIVAKRVPQATLVGNFFEGENGELLDNKAIPNDNGSLLVGIPSLWSLPLVGWALPRGGGGKAAHGDYAPIIPNSGKMVLEWIRACRPHYEAAGVEPMVDFFMHERHVIMVNMFTFNQEDPDHRNKIHKLYHNFHAESKKRGYGMYRAHVNHMDLIAGLSDFNNHAYNRFIEKLKDAVDPNGILSPGKSGIWPERYRHLREGGAIPEKQASHL